MKILVAEDSRTFRAYLQDMLSQWGYQVVAASNGAEAWDVLQSPDPPALSILDWEMPHLDGVEICRRARSLQDQSFRYFIMLSSQKGGRNIADALEAGADDYVLKTVNPEELRARIQVGIRLITLQRRLANHANSLNRLLAERKQITEERQIAHAKNEQILASLAVVLISVDEHDCVAQWNTMAETTFGIRAIDVLNQPFLHCGIPWDWPEVAKAVAACRDMDRSIKLNDLRYRCPDGKKGVLSLTVNPISTAVESSVIRGFLLLAEDITEHRLLERQLVQAQKLESIGQLAAGIAHEINTPIQYVGDNTRFLEGAFTDLLKVLDGFTCLLKESKSAMVPAECLQAMDTVVEDADLEFLTQEIPRAITQSLEGVERVAKIVRAMKDFSHPGVEEKMSIDINKAIESTITVARNEWKYVAELVTEFDEQLPLVPCVPGEFNQIILNIIVNAAHAIADAVGENSGRKGVITVITRHTGAWAEIRIADTGSGIPEAVRTKIFDPFFTTKEVGRGTGQGLAIVHSVVTEKHGGSVKFDTKIGQGTTFIIRLPLEHEAS